MPNTKITNLTDGRPCQASDEFPVNRAGVDRKMTGSSIASLAGYADIRDYGAVTSGGDITAAWVAAVAAFSTHKCLRIRVPMVGTGSYIVDGTTLNATTANGVPFIFELDCTQLLLTSTLRIGSNQTWRGLRNGAFNLFLSGPMPFPGIAMATGINLTTADYDAQPGTGQTNTLVENLQFYGNPTNGNGLHVNSGSLHTIRNCWFTSDGPGYPLHVDTVFWLTMTDIFAQARAAGDFSSIRFSTDQNNATLATGLIRCKEVKTVTTGIDFAATSAASSIVGNIEIYDLASEAQVAGTSLLNFDSQVQAVGSIKIVRPIIADSVGTVYLIKNTSTQFTRTSGVEIEGTSIPTSTGATQLYDPASTHPIDNLTLIDNTNDNFAAALPVQLADYYGGTPLHGSWSRWYRNTLDAKLACAPVPGANWNYGTPLAVKQDPALWTAAAVPNGTGSSTITGGFRGPDGSSMAGKSTSTVSFTGGTISTTIAVGDWIIAGVWVLNLVGGNTVVGVSAGLNPFNWGHQFNGESNPAANFDFGKNHDLAANDGWKWVCGANKCTFAGTNPAPFEFSANATSNFLFFAPAAVLIPASAGLPDSWMMRIARMLRGGWSPNSVAGDVSIQDHQALMCGNGLRFPAELSDIGTSTVGLSTLHMKSGGTLNFDGGDVTVTHNAANTLTVAGGDLFVPDEVYSAVGWDGDLSVPTKNAVRDKIESLATGSQTPWTSDIAAAGFDLLDAGSLFLRTGEKIDFNSGDVTITHSANALTVVGGDIVLGGGDITTTDVASVINLTPNSNATYTGVTVNNANTGAAAVGVIQVINGTDAEFSLIAYHNLGFCSIQADDGRLVFVTVTAEDIRFQTNSTPRWNIDSTLGHWIPQADATYDIGTSALGLRTLNFGAGGTIDFDGDITFTHTGTNQLAMAGGLLGHSSNSATIATGVITATANYMVVDTEAAAATDDLDTINGGIDGAVLTIRAANSSRDVVIKDGTQIKCAGDFTLDNVEDTITLRFDAVLSQWLEMSRSNNGA